MENKLKQLDLGGLYILLKVKSPRYPEFKAMRQEDFFGLTLSEQALLLVQELDSRGFPDFDDRRQQTTVDTFLESEIGKEARNTLELEVRREIFKLFKSLEEQGPNLRTVNESQFSRMTQGLQALTLVREIRHHDTQDFTGEQKVLCAKFLKTVAGKNALGKLDKILKKEGKPSFFKREQTNHPSPQKGRENEKDSSEIPVKTENQEPLQVAS